MSLEEELRRIAGLKVKVNEPLAPYTSIKIGGPADYLVDVETGAALAQLLRLLHDARTPFHLLGKGSNVLASDLGVRGAVLRLGGEFKQTEWEDGEKEVTVSAGGAVAVTQLVREAARRGCAGLEFAEGIPGSVGGALFMNAGAYGSEMERIVERVEALSARGEPILLSRSEMTFSYRDSHLAAGIVVTRVRLRLGRDDPAEVRRKLGELVSRRKKSQPGGYPNCGSVFRNPAGDFAGRLIEAAGLKGRKIGRAQISEKHANFIVNLGGAKAEEVKQLMELARAEVRRAFGVELEPEVRLWGEWPAEQRRN